MMNPGQIFTREQLLNRIWGAILQTVNPSMWGIIISSIIKSIGLLFNIIKASIPSSAVKQVCPRRSSSEPLELLSIGKISVMPSSHKVFLDGQEISLTHTESLANKTFGLKGLVV